MNEHFRWIAAATISLLLAGPAWATMMLPMTVDELAEASDVVARGRVASAESHPSADGGRIFTLVTFEVSEAWKGSPGERLAIRVPGGSYDGISQVVVGSPRFVVGEEAVVFVRRLDRASAEKGAITQVVGMAQGKLQVRVDDEGHAVAIQELAGLALVDPRTQEPAAPPLSGPLPLSRLEAQVRATIR